MISQITYQNHLALEELGYVLLLGLCCCLAWRLSGYVVCKQRGTMVQKDLLHVMSKGCMTGNGLDLKLKKIDYKIVTKLESSCKNTGQLGPMKSLKILSRSLLITLCLNDVIEKMDAIESYFLSYQTSRTACLSFELFIRANE